MTSQNTAYGSLSAARDLLGGIKHPSSASTEAQNYRVYKSDYKSLVFMDTLCTAMIVDALVNAAHLFGYKKIKKDIPLKGAHLYRAREAYAFISGTGLDKVIEYYQIDLNADELRSRFMSIWRQSA